MKKFLTVIGARPQFIKAAVVSRDFFIDGRFNEVIVHTGQHYDSNMSEVFFDELNIPRPAYNLGIGGGTHGQNTGRMIEAIENVLLKENPCWVIVYGDTDSTLAGALSASKLDIPIVHIEAGLRSFNRKMPEEINRVLTDHCSSLLFAPTQTAVGNLITEGIQIAKIVNVGDVMYDASIYYGKIADKKSKILKALNLKPKHYILSTLHRQENTDNVDRLTNILAGLGDSRRTIVMPLHPRTKRRLSELSIHLPKNILSIEPVGYIDMVMLEKNASIIVTDSGGVQKEAYFHKVPCLTLRDETEWVELLHPGVNCLLGDHTHKISDSINRDIVFTNDIGKPFGDGESGKKIVENISMSF